MSDTNVFFSAIQSALDAHIERMVEARVSALTDHVAALVLRVTALEQAQPAAQAIPVDEAKMVEALNSQEWFWEKVGRVVDGKVEEAIDAHCSTYDHDEYDGVVNEWGGESTGDFVKEGDLNSAVEESIRDVLHNATLSISV